MLFRMLSALCITLALKMPHGFFLIIETLSNFYIYPELLKYDIQWQGFKI